MGRSCRFARTELQLCCAFMCLLSCRDALASTPFNFGPGSAAGLDGWFSHAQLGLFFHWTPASQKGWEITYPLLCCPPDDLGCDGAPSFSTNRSFPCIITLYPHGQWKSINASNPEGMITINSEQELVQQRQRYYNLSQTFNPTEFDPRAMAKLAKSAGFKYIVFTAVNCDGFMNWNTSLSDYSVMHTPWAKDTFGMLAAAFREEGLRVGAYVNPSQIQSDLYVPAQPSPLSLIHLTTI